MKHLITAAVALIFSTTAVAGLFGKSEWESEDCPKKHSLAWCLADYQGRSDGLRDMSQEEFAAQLKKIGITNETDIGNLVRDSIGVGAGVGNFLLGNMLGGGVFFLSAVMPGREEQFKRDSYVVFFDKNVDRNPQQMTTDYDAVIIEAIRSGLKTLPTDLQVSEVPIKDHIYYKVTNGKGACHEKYDCLIGSWHYPDIMTNKIRKLPIYMGNETVVSARVGSVSDFEFRTENNINRAMVAKAISERMPPWMYWFIPAGYLGNNPFPLFLNQGKALFFVKPKDGDAVPEMPHVLIKQVVSGAPQKAESQK